MAKARLHSHRIDVEPDGDMASEVNIQVFIFQGLQMHTILCCKCYTCDEAAVTDSQPSTTVWSPSLAHTFVQTWFFALAVLADVLCPLLHSGGEIMPFHALLCTVIMARCPFVSSLFPQTNTCL